MTKVWDGPTPYDGDIADDPTENGNFDRRYGYIAAMDSQVVRAMYELLELLLLELLPEDEWNSDFDKLAAVVNAYKTGLREENAEA